MPKLHVIYDPQDKVVTIPEAEYKFGFKTAQLSVPADLKSVDIYNLARRLAELLVEQL
jgi:hypothetical protein